MAGPLTRRVRVRTQIATSHSMLFVLIDERQKQFQCKFTYLCNKIAVVAIDIINHSRTQHVQQLRCFINYRTLSKSNQTAQKKRLNCHLHNISPICCTQSDLHANSLLSSLTKWSQLLAGWLVGWMG